jgi:hypothetical protein
MTTLRVVMPLVVVMMATSCSAPSTADAGADGGAAIEAACAVDAAAACATFFSGVALVAALTGAGFLAGAAFGAAFLAGAFATDFVDFFAGAALMGAVPKWASMALRAWSFSASERVWALPTARRAPVADSYFFDFSASLNDASDSLS